MNQAIRRTVEQSGVSVEVVSAVADARGDDPSSLDENLYDVLNPDALDRLFARREAASATDVELSFEFAGCHVTVTSEDDAVVVEAAPSAVA